MRIRTIKPEFFLHEGLFDLEKEMKAPIRLAFAGLWCAADREGRFKWSPRTLKAQILPHDEVDFSRVLDALTTRGFVVRYASGGCEFGVIPSFKRHQVINNRERPSELPEPPQEAYIQPVDASSTRDERVEHASAESESGREGKGREQGREGNNRAGEGGVVAAETALPSLKEVTAYASMIGLAEWKARDWFEEMESVGWIDFRHRRVVAWQPMLNRVRTKWEADGRPMHAPSNRSNGKAPSVMDLKTAIAIKEEKAAQLKNLHFSDGPLGGHWDGQETFEEFRGIRAEIRKLKEQIERMVA